ncbi:MAG: DNA polymerase Y family protein [Candidatus Avilachnospira sp.]
MRDRVILHSDLNGFFASVEIMLDPRLSGKAVAVSGLTEERHGIVLAKSERAKSFGIKTGMTNGEAMRLCPELVLLRPHYDQYVKYSRLAREIYGRYTDLVEPYGIDECFLDVTGSGIFGSGKEIADKIRRDMREELGLTVSVGVSFNKVFAKLGSDMKKPDAVTVIGREDFKRKVWPMPVGDLLYCGRKSAALLESNMIKTIGDLACSDRDYITGLLGKSGDELWCYANGLDDKAVDPYKRDGSAKSLGHGVTCTEDISGKEEVGSVVRYLAEAVAHGLRENKMKAMGINLSTRDSMLKKHSRQAALSVPIRNPQDIAEKAMELFDKDGDTDKKLRSVTVTAIDLVPENSQVQLSFFADIEKTEKKERLFEAIDDIRMRFGREAVKTAAFFCRECSGELKLPGRKLQGSV